MNPIIQESKTLWIGDIDHWMDESYIASLFAGSGAVNSVKVIRDKNTGLPAGYGFVEFRDHQAANNVLATYNGKTIPGTNKSFKLNWGVFGGGTKTAGETAEKPERGERSSRFSSRFSSQQQQAPEPTPAQNKSAPPGPEHSIYVGELDASVNESVLTEFFQRRYRSVLGSKVITDPVTKQCKGFGFVKFSDNNEAQAAIREMQGSILRGRALKTSQAYTKNQAQDTTTTNLSSMMNPYAMLANNPMLLNTLGSLTGLSGMPGMPGMAGMAGMGAYGAQNMQYGAYGAGMMGAPMMQGYGQVQGMQGMYGYGGDVQQQQVYQGYGQQQAYGQQPQAGQMGGMGGNAFVGSYFDPLNQGGGGYQQYGVPQQGQPQMYGQDGSSYLPQQQQQQYNVYTPQSGGQVNVYGQQQVYQAVDANNLNVNQQQQGGGQNGVEAENNGHGHGQLAVEQKANMEEEEASEEVMRYNTTCIGNSFHFDFINGEKMKATL